MPTCGTLIFVGIRNAVEHGRDLEQVCGRPAVAILDQGTEYAYPVCAEHARDVHASRLTYLESSRPRVTTGPCPLCGPCDEDVQIRHVIDGFTGSRLHAWNCPDCGEHVVIVGYDCPDCPPEPAPRDRRAI
jgi:hypothetical protein